MTDRATLAEGWIALQHTERNTEDYEKRFWAFNEACDLLFKDPEAFWELILLIFEKDKSNRIKENLSAGPLEDLLAQHGKQFIERIENKAKSDREFANVLGGVWKNAMTDEIWNRVQAVWDRSGWDGN